MQLLTTNLERQMIDLVKMDNVWFSKQCSRPNGIRKKESYAKHSKESRCNSESITVANYYII